MMDDTARSGTTRLDKWLWYARFFKTRGLATEAVSAGAVRVNSTRVTKPATPLRPGDGLSLMQGGRVRVIRVLELGSRRGPATEARTLYLDLDEPHAEAPPPLDPERQAVK